MQRNLTVKAITIVVVVLACLFGIVGYPHFLGGIGVPVTIAQLESNLSQNIHLGLDLKGGSHLVLQVQVQDAAKTVADQAIESLRDATKSADITVAGFDRNDPATLEATDSIQINIHGVDQTKTQAFRNLVADKYPDWVLAPLNATDYKMNMKPSALVDLKRNTVAQERDTIERRVNALGLTEPTVQDYGASEKQSEILVELPGVDDPGRVKDLIGTTAQLKIVEVKNEGPWTTREAGLAGCPWPFVLHFHNFELRGGADQVFHAAGIVHSRQFDQNLGLLFGCPVILHGRLGQTEGVHAPLNRIPFLRHGVSFEIDQRARLHVHLVIGRVQGREDTVRILVGDQVAKRLRLRLVDTVNVDLNGIGGFESGRVVAVETRDGDVRAFRCVAERFLSLIHI